ncbi:Cytochrome P450 4V2 [Araneus ventricosus]|uniref:Cytochrome P450 4V2 n=1 Tax=Araneus ventricosus TaxID=182803 RepID=A0A4Y2QF84_ARAVE|nr:Cytochrome P450 4V2 [Araneus ventricosus]
MVIRRFQQGEWGVKVAQQILLGHAKLLEQEKLYCEWLFFYPVVVLSKAGAVEAVYSGMKSIEKSFFYRFGNLFVGNGAITSGGHEWRAQRKMLNPCFRSDILKEHLQIINVQSQILAKRLEGETEKDFTKISKYLSACTFDIICEIIYGVDMKTQQSKKEREPVVYSFNRYV